MQIIIIITISINYINSINKNIVSIIIIYSKF